MSAAERSGGQLDSALAALELEVGANRRFVNRDDDVFERELFAIFLVAEPYAQPEFLEHALQDRPVADHGFELPTDLHGGWLDGPFERELALARLGANAQHAASAAQRLIGTVEQRILLQPPSPQRRRVEREHGGPRRFSRVEAQFDFPFNANHVFGPVGFGLRASGFGLQASYSRHSGTSVTGTRPRAC